MWGRKKEEKDLFYNLGITFCGFENVSNFSELMRLREGLNIVKYLLVDENNNEGPFTVDAHVTSKGVIIPGDVTGLHTYQMSLNLVERTNLSTGEDLVLAYPNTPGMGKYLTHLGTGGKLKSNLISSFKRYTLEGLYATIDGETHNYEKVNLVKRELSKATINTDCILAEGTGEILEILENAYRQNISDQ